MKDIYKELKNAIQDCFPDKELITLKVNMHQDVQQINVMSQFYPTSYGKMETMLLFSVACSRHYQLTKSQQIESISDTLNKRIVRCESSMACDSSKRITMYTAELGNQSIEEFVKVLKKEGREAIFAEFDKEVDKLLSE